MKLNELIAKRNADVAKFKALVESAEQNADGKLTDEQQEEYDTLKASIADQDGRIERVRAASSFDAVAPEQTDRVSRVAQNETNEQRKAPAVKSGKYAYSKNQFKVLNHEHAYEQAQMFLAVAGSGKTRDRAISYCETHNLPLHATITTGMGTTALSAAVPELFSSDVWDYFATYGLVGQYAKNHVLTSKKLNVPKRTGGVTVYIPGEETAITNSAQTWTEYELEPIKMTTLVYIPSEAAEDEVVGLVDNCLQDSARAFAEKEDTLALTNAGSGNKGITSILADGDHDASMIPVVLDSAGGLWDDIQLSDLETAAALVPSKYRTQGELAWYCHDVALFKVFNRIGLSGNGNPKVDFATGPEPTFMGYPIRTTPVMYSNLADGTGAGECAILFGNMRASTAYGVRREFTAEPFREYTQDLNGILCTRRVAYVNHELGSDTVPGPMIGIFGA